MPFDRPEYYRRYYLQHKERYREASRRYRENRPERIKASREKWNDNHPDYGKKRWQLVKQKALSCIAKFWGDEKPRCRIDLTPNVPTSSLPCLGELQIDHLSGGGSKERRTKQHGRRIHLTDDVISGRRQVNDLRVLCQLHQLWNQIRESDKES